MFYAKNESYTAGLHISSVGAVTPNFLIIVMVDGNQHSVFHKLIRISILVAMGTVLKIKNKIFTVIFIDIGKNYK